MLPWQSRASLGVQLVLVPSAGENRGVMGFNLIWMFDRTEILMELADGLQSLNLPPPHVGDRFPFTEVWPPSPVATQPCSRDAMATWIPKASAGCFACGSKADKCLAYPASNKQTSEIALVTPCGAPDDSPVFHFQAPNAIRKLQSGTTKGKVVLVME